MASTDMMNHNDVGCSGEPHVKYNNFVDTDASPGPSGKGPLNKLKKYVLLRTPFITVSFTLLMLSWVLKKHFSLF